MSGTRLRLVIQHHGRTSRMAHDMQHQWLYHAHHQCHLTPPAFLLHHVLVHSPVIPQTFHPPILQYQLAPTDSGHGHSTTNCQGRSCKHQPCYNNAQAPKDVTKGGSQTPPRHRGCHGTPTIQRGKGSPSLHLPVLKWIKWTLAVHNGPLPADKVWNSPTDRLMARCSTCESRSRLIVPLTSTKTACIECSTSKTKCSFSPFSQACIDRLIATGELLGKSKKVAGKRKISEEYGPGEGWKRCEEEEAPASGQL